MKILWKIQVIFKDFSTDIVPKLPIEDTGDNLMPMLLKPSYTTGETEKSVEVEEQVDNNAGFTNFNTNKELHIFL